MVDVGVLTRWIPAKLFLEFPDQIDKSAGGTPGENTVELYLAGHVFDQGVRYPLGDVDQRLVLGESSEKNAANSTGGTF